MNTIKKISYLILSAGIFIACDTDDDSVTAQEDPETADARAELYTSNNSDGNITIYDVRDTSNVTARSLTTASTDAEGIYYDPNDDEVTQASRSNLQLNAYADIFSAVTNISISASTSSSASLISPRDIAVNGNIFVVSDNADVDGDDTTADGRFFIFIKNDDSFELRNTVITDFAVWGIEFVGNTLYAVADKTSDVAIFANFAASNTTDATITPTKRITIEGIVRTHGIAERNGTMILTDIGDAMSDSDGAFHIISDFESKFDSVNNGDVLLVANNQIRIAGENTFLGNPVSAEYDAQNEIVYIAERANGGGRVLAFTSAEAGGNLTPSINNSLSGASSLYLYQE